METNVMVDLETMSMHPDAVITSIGACIFDLETGEIGKDTFYYSVDMRSCERAGMKFDASTIEWWLSQSDDARRAICLNTVNIEYVLFEFKKYFPEGAKLWAHSSFDSVILSSAFTSIDWITPWKYNATRDIRTLSALAENLGCNVEKVKPKIPHHALSDAVAQAHYVSKLYRAILNR